MEFITLQRLLFRDFRPQGAVIKAILGIVKSKQMHKTICGTLANSCCRNLTYGTLAQIMKCTELSPLRFAILMLGPH